MHSSEPPINRRRRARRILRLFFGLVLSFLFQYARARITGRSYDFFTDSEHNRRRAIRIRQTALEMGGVLIKVGQFLSSRVDLLPTEYIEELALLQDEVPSVPFAQIEAVLVAEFGDRLGTVFASIDPIPLAAASLGQVHRATLLTGETVAVKVQRPRIDEIVDADMGSLRYVVHWLDRHTAIGRRADLPQVFREFEASLHLELDYVNEGHNAERLAVLFYDDPQVAIPRIHWSATTPRVLTMQFMSGTKVTDFAGLEADGISRSSTAELLMRTYLQQVLEFGFFHADPHPGNIFVRPGPVIVFLDFGLVGIISPRIRRDIRNVFLGVIRRDFDSVLAALARLGFILPGADMAVLKRALVWTVNTFYELSFAELKAVDPRQVLDQLQDVLYEESFRIPAEFAFLGRALGTLSGLSTALDPSFQFVTVAEPFARRLIVGERTVRGLVSQAATEARVLGRTLVALPEMSRHVLGGIESGELNFRVDLDEAIRAVDTLETAIRRVLYALLVSAFLVAGAFILRSHLTVYALGAFIVSLIFMIGAFSPRRGRRRTNRIRRGG